jgi:hypothetical protein
VTGEASAGTSKAASVTADSLAGTSATVGDTADTSGALTVTSVEPDLERLDMMLLLSVEFGSGWLNRITAVGGRAGCNAPPLSGDKLPVTFVGLRLG